MVNPLPDVSVALLHLTLLCKMGLIFTFILVQLLNLKTTSIQAGIWTKLSACLKLY